MSEGLSEGAVGGAAAEAGGVQRGGVFAFIAAHILLGKPLRVLGFPVDQSVPIHVRVEVDAEVDDVEVQCRGGAIARGQVKTRLTSRAMDDCIAQWVDLATARDIDATGERLLACGASAVQRVQDLEQGLKRLQDPFSGTPTKAAQEALQDLREKLQDVPADHADALLRSAGVWVADYAKDAASGEELGAALLDGSVVEHGHGLAAWRLLRDQGRGLAAQRGGTDLDRLLDFLRSNKVPLVVDARGVEAAQRAAQQVAVGDYLRAVAERGRNVALDALGTGLSPLPLHDLDMSVNAAAGPPDAEREPGTGHDLAWLVRAHGRVLLCGPPGSGKSVALRATAADYAEWEDWPLPLFIDLGRWNRRRRSVGDREALLDVAFELEPAAARPLLHSAAERALESGRCVLLFDSLDETGRSRREVLASLRRLLDRVQEDVEVVVSTRDVAYADARALDFADLSLVPPGHPEVTVHALLEAIAERDGVAPADRDTWVSERSAWVTAHLEHDRTLRRTPLVVVLLTLLAAAHRPDDLPATRGAVLARVTRDLVDRWEAEARQKDEELRLGPLTLPAASDAAHLAFVVIGHTVLTEPGIRAPRVVPSVAAALRDEYGLPAGQARAAAEDAVHLWDTAGVFTKVGANEELTARVQSLAELAEAVHAIGDLAAVADWVARAIEDDALREPLQLAANLEQTAANELLRAAGEQGTWAAYKQVIEAFRAGACPSPDAIEQLADRLTERVTPTGEADDWAAAVCLARLPLSAPQQGAALEALDRLPGGPRTVARAIAVEGWDRTDESVEQDLRSILDQDPGEVPVLEESQRAWFGLGPDPHSAAAYTIAANALLGPDDPDFARRVMADADTRLAGGASWRVRSRLIELGYEQLLEEHDRQAVPDAPPPGHTMRAMDDLLAMWEATQRAVEDALLSRVEPAELTWREHRRLDSAANLRETLDLGGHRPGSVLKALRDHPEDLAHLADALAALSSLDMPVAVAQLRDLRAIDAQPGDRASFAITSAAHRVEPAVDWKRLQDARTTALGLVDAVAHGREWVAWTATMLLASLPGALREGVLVRVEDHRQGATGRALELLTIVWLMTDSSAGAQQQALMDDRPPTRRALIDIVSVIEDKVGVLSRLVGDQDAVVRERAVYAASRRGLLETALAEAGPIAPPIGWECSWCTTPNPPDRDSCERCRTSRAPTRQT